MPSDRLLIAVTEDGLLRGRAIAGTELVRNAVRPHDPTPLATRAIGRAALAAALFPVSWKDIDRISIQWSGSGPLGSVMADVREGDLVRAKVSDPSAVLDARMTFSGRRGIGYGLLPHGFVSVIRQRRNGSFDRGQIDLKNGEIDEDLEAFFHKSDQTRTRLRGHVDVDDAGGGVRLATGLLVQALPGDDDQALPEFDLSEEEAANASPEKLLEHGFGGRPFRVLETRAPSYQCTCDAERFASGLMLLESSELLEMINEDQGARLSCDFCRTVYTFNREQLEDIFAIKFTHEQELERKKNQPPETEG